MYKALVLLCCVITLILVSTTEAKGGRGGGGRGGRSSGRGSGKSSRGGGFFSSSSGGKSPSSFGGGKSGNSFSGGLFHGFFHSTPYRYTYRPTHIVHTSSSHTGSYHTLTREEEEAEQNKETDNYAVGYSISKGLSNDFFSIFNVVHDISKYPDKIRNKELLTTTTPSPVSTYDSNYIVTPSYTITATANRVDTESNYFDTDPYFAAIHLKNMQEIVEMIEKMSSDFEVASTKRPSIRTSSDSTNEPIDEVNREML